MSEGRSWQGNWPVHLYERVRELGYDSLTAFAKARKALGLWSAFTPETHQERADQVMAALRVTPPPPGWRPLGPDDELRRTLLPDEEA